VDVDWASLPALTRLESFLSNPTAVYQHDSEASSLLKQLASERPPKNYIVDDYGALFYSPSSKDVKRLYVPQRLRNEVLTLLHSNPLSGHLAKDKTTKRIKRYFHWEGIDADVVDFIKSCDACTSSKYRTHKASKIHVPYPIPDYPWQVFYMDFKTGLPRTKRGHDSFVVFVDKLTKRMHAVPCKKTITSEQTAHIVFWEIIRHHGIPETVISDRGPQFTAAYWKTLWTTIFTKLNMSTARHPNTDSQAERGVRTIVEMLRSFCHENVTDWDDLIGANEFAYNDSVHPLTGYTPFQLDIGRTPHTPISLMLKRFQTSISGSDNSFAFLSRWSQSIEQTKRRLEEYNDKQAKLLRSRSSAPIFYEPGDWVKIENPSVNDIRRLPALVDRFIGPYKVLEVVAPGTYKLDFAGSKDSRVIHRHPNISGEKMKPYSFRRLDTPIFDEDTNLPSTTQTDLISPSLLKPSLVPPLPIAINLPPPNVIQLPPAQHEQVVLPPLPTPDVDVAQVPQIDPVVPETETKPQLEFIGFDKVEIQGLTTAVVNIRFGSLLTTADDFLETDKAANSKIKRKKLFGLFKQLLQKLPSSNFTSPFDSIGSVLKLKLHNRAISVCVLAVDQEGSAYLLWSDGDAKGVTKESWDQMSSHQINLTLADLHEHNWNLRDPTDMKRLLTTLTPGAWNEQHATKLSNQVLGGSRFNPLLVVTDNEEVQSLIKCLKMDKLKSKLGLDPFAGTRAIPQGFAKEGVKLYTNDLNPLFPAHFHLDALNPSSYVPGKLCRFDYVVTSIPFAFADIAVPLLMLSYEAIFLHLPSWYLFQGSRFRHEYLKDLVLQRRIITLNVNKTRNKQFGKFAIWVCIFKTRDLAHTYLTNVNQFFEQSLSVYFG
jgi:hypothetical protein